MKDAYILGADIGTTGTKTILFRADGTPIAHAYRGYTLKTPKVGYSEHDAEEYLSALAETVREVLSGRDIADKVVSVALSTQGGTLIPTDKAGKPLAPAIVWNDHRCTAEKEMFLKEFPSADVMYRKTGWKLGTGLPALEIRHMRENDHALFEKVDYFLTVPSFISLRLTGKAAVDLSNAGIDQLTDIKSASYDKALLRFAGIEEERLPVHIPSGKPIGKLSKEGAALLGLTENTLLVSGAHDQYAVALGAGATESGDILIGSGTCWVVTALGSEPDFESNLAQSVSAVSGLWGSLLSLSSGGVCLEWLRKNIAVGEDGALIDFKTLDREAEAVTAAEDGLFFFPFAGTYGDGRFKKASFTGLDLSHTRFHMARAVMEGIVFQIIWFLEAFKTKPGEETGLTLAGGASKSRLWAQMLADVSGLPVRIPALADLSCVGAALLAGTGAGLYQNAKEAYLSFAVKETLLLPDPHAHARYRTIFEDYKRAAKALGSL